MHGASLDRDYLHLSLGEGELYGLQACDRAVGLLFVGEGEVSVGSPGPQRTPQLHDRSPDLPGTVLLDAVLLIGADGAVSELLDAVGGLGDGPVPPSAWSLTQSRMNGFLSINNDGWRPPGEVLASPDPAGGGLLVDVRTKGMRMTRPERSLEVLSPWLTYVWAPSGPLGDPREPGLLLRRANGSTVPLLFGGFPSAAAVAEQGTPYALETQTGPWDLEDVVVSLATSGPIGPDRQLDSVHCTADLTLRGSQDARHVLLDLDDGVRRVYGAPWAPLVVQGVARIDDDGAHPIEWLRTGNRLWASLEEPVPVGASVVLRVTWTGQILEPRGRTAIRVLDRGAWYPRTPGLDPHTFTATVAVPRFWEVVASGHRIGEEVQGTVKIVTTRESRPIPGGAVAIADVRTELLRPAAPGVPLVRIHRGAEQPVANARIGVELRQLLQVLVGVLGPFPYSELEIIERGPGTIGFETLPGVIALPSFDSPPGQVVTTRVATDTLLGALARQWLGVDRGAESYHDRWLVEGLVTWARCLTLESVDKGARCYGELASWRRAWVDTMTGAPAGSDPTARDLLAGAVWLDETSGAPGANRSQRGPLILHSLRLLVGDPVVRATLRAVAQDVRPISLAAFLEAIQGEAHIDLRAFVYGWVLNTPSLPTASLLYQVDRRGDSWTLSGLGVVRGDRLTEPPLPLPTPLLLAFDVGAETVVHRIVLTEVESALRIDGLPEKPKNVRLDPGKTFPGKVEVSRMDPASP